MGGALSILIRLSAVLVVVANAATPALAKPIIQAAYPSSWSESLLSGLSHPVMGLEHLAYAVVIGLVSAFFIEHAMRLVLTFVGAVALGLALRFGAVAMPFADVCASVSVFFAGVALVQRKVDAPRAWIVFSGIAGLAHGAALGGPVVGLSYPLFLCYLAGVMTSLGLVIVSMSTFAEHVLLDERSDELKVQATGGAVTALGVFFVVTSIAGS